MEFCKAEGLVLLADEVCAENFAFYCFERFLGYLLFLLSRKFTFNTFRKIFLFDVNNIIDNPNNLGIPRKCLCS